MADNDIPFFLCQLRKEKGITQSDLGDAIGVSNKTVSKWENGSFLPDVTMLKTIADYYGITTDELLNGKKNPIINKKNKIFIRSKLKLIIQFGFFSIMIMIAFVNNIYNQTNDEFSFIINVVTLIPTFFFAVWKLIVSIFKEEK